MKYTMIFSMLFAAVIIFGQNPMNDNPPSLDKKAIEKIEAQKVAFFTRILELTPQEAEKFWPLYNEYSTKERQLRMDIRKKNPRNLTEEEAEKLIEKIFDNEQKRLNLTRNYYNKFKLILPATKVVKLRFAERRFKEKLLKKLKGKRNKRRKR